MQQFVVTIEDDGTVRARATDAPPVEQPMWTDEAIVFLRSLDVPTVEREALEGSTMADSATAATLKWLIRTLEMAR